MKKDQTQKEIIEEITNFVMTSTDTENMILSAFIAGIQVGRYQVSPEDIADKAQSNIHMFHN